MGVSLFDLSEAYLRIESLAKIKFEGKGYSVKNRGNINLFFVILVSNRKMRTG